jgi:hypothetical protein
MRMLLTKTVGPRTMELGGYVLMELFVCVLQHTKLCSKNTGETCLLSKLRSKMLGNN